MGGKRWTVEEESIFWREIARKAPSGLDAKGKKGKKGIAEEMSWRPLVKRMKRRMKEVYPKLEARREYTTFSCYEHYFQNYIQGKPSPNAGPYLAEYKAWLERKQATNSKHPATHVSPEALTAIKRNTRAARRQNAAPRCMGPAPTSPDVCNAIQMASDAPMQALTFDSPTDLTTAPGTPATDQTSVTTAHGLYAESPGPQGGLQSQVVPAYECPSYPGHSYPSGTGSFSETSISRNQRTPAQFTTQNYGDFVFDGSMLTHPTTNDYGDSGFDGFIPAPRGYGSSNGLPIQFSDFLAAQYGQVNGDFNQANRSYDYDGLGVYSSCNATKARFDPVLDPHFHQFPSSV